jgi:hypothetical protein
MTTPKQTPLGINVQGSLLQGVGININPINQTYIGTSKVNPTYTFGSIVSGTCLNLLTYAINDAYVRGVVTKTPAGSSVYDDLISIGEGYCSALGNSKPPTYAAVDPSGQWTGAGAPATTGYANDINPDYPNNDEGQGQEASWLPYDTTNPNNAVTQWGFLRNYALQAWNEFNYNGSSPSNTAVSYKDFLGSFLTAKGFIEDTNVSIHAIANSGTFLKGTYSNMNDLTSADVTGVNLATAEFGQDCIKAGKAIDLSKISKFGLPSVLLQTIKKYNAISQSLTVAFLSAGLEPDEVEAIANNTIPYVTKQQEQQIYGAFLVIVGTDLQDILVPLNCKTRGLESLADLLNIKKLFPNSYMSLTVPVYNTTEGPTNSKTYYPIFENNGVSPRLKNPTIATQIGEVLPAGTPPVVESTLILTVENTSSYLDDSDLPVNGQGI